MNHLTEAEALAGIQPPKLTKEEWKQLHYASLLAQFDAEKRHNNRLSYALLDQKKGAT